MIPLTYYQIVVDTCDVKTLENLWKTSKAVRLTINQLLGCVPDNAKFPTEELGIKAVTLRHYQCLNLMLRVWKKPDVPDNALDWDSMFLEANRDNVLMWTRIVRVAVLSQRADIARYISEKLPINILKNSICSDVMKTVLEFIDASLIKEISWIFQYLSTELINRFFASTNSSIVELVCRMTPSLALLEAAIMQENLSAIVILEKSVNLNYYLRTTLWYLKAPESIVKRYIPRALTLKNYDFIMIVCKSKILTRPIMKALIENLDNTSYLLFRLSLRGDIPLIKMLMEDRINHEQPAITDQEIALIEEELDVGIDVISFLKGRITR